MKCYSEQHTQTRKCTYEDSHLSKCDHIHSSARGIVISEIVGYDLKRAIRDVKTYTSNIGWLLRGGNSDKQSR